MNYKKIICNDDPKICVYDNFLEPNICKYFIKKYRSSLNHSLTSDGKIYTKNSQRISKSTVIPESDNFGKICIKSINNVNKWDNTNHEKLQITKYEVNGEYKPHYDAFDILNKDNLDHDIINSGQRLITNIIYLNDSFIGGETYFPKIDKMIKPRIGRLLTFENCIKNTNFLHPYSIHQSLPIQSGEKWIMVNWNREINS